MAGNSGGPCTGGPIQWHGAPTSGDGWWRRRRASARGRGLNGVRWWWWRRAGALEPLVWGLCHSQLAQHGSRRLGPGKRHPAKRRWAAGARPDGWRRRLRDELGGVGVGALVGCRRVGISPVQRCGYQRWYDVSDISGRNAELQRRGRSWALQLWRARQWGRNVRECSRFNVWGGLGQLWSRS